MRRSGSKYKEIKEKAKVIAEHLYQQVTKDERFMKTGDIVPPGNLHAASVAESLKWATADKFGKRYFTRAALEEAISDLLKTYNLRVPLQPTQTLESWVVDQSSRIQHLLARVRKNCAARELYKFYWGHMDDAETQPVAPLQKLY